MGSLVLVGVLVVLAIVVMKLPLPGVFSKLKGIAASVLIVGATAVTGLTAASYNDAGYCQHIRTIFGTESVRCTTGWYFQGWGPSTQWPHFITVAHTKNPADQGSAISGPYDVRLADNWNGKITQTTRFGIPQEETQFLKMARDFRSPGRLITTTLRPAVTQSLDSVANLFTMEQYYAGGQRDEFKNEFLNAVVSGRAKVIQVEENIFQQSANNKVAPSDQAEAQDTSNVGDSKVRRVFMRKVTDSETGDVVRVQHGYHGYGVVVSSAILENLDPDDLFEEQIQARKEAASRRIVAREERKEQEEQRLLAIQRGETNIAKKQAEAKVVQIEQTTNAETKKKLALIAATRVRDSARVSKETAVIKLAQAKIDAESIKVTADAEAHAKEVLITADGALEKKLAAYVKAQTVWAEAAGKIAVPSTVFGGGGSQGVDPGNAMAKTAAFMDILTVKAAKDLQLDLSIKK